MVSENRALRLASIAGLIFGAMLVAIGIYRYFTEGAVTSIGAGWGAMVIAGICCQASKRGRGEEKDRVL